ncbi:hypothetical protein RFI_36556 [Reticulomyxa filosa]|uniref:Viral A-type inclusion protein n=1 Tax=Reticulomyxa filosa TaxID=46433 RepID=X6LH41_RETFI|nr:hypothetical protein RFI_36556 [Reticulomyxa filosa]|eukprot:ETO00884.1 hypothetical protein RFI_36556 [Reticulomyxa filosa]
MNKLSLENETLKVELQFKSKKDEEISHLKQQLDQYQKDNIKLISDQAFYIFIFKTTFIEIKKLKKDIESKNNEIQIMKYYILLH